MPTFYQRLIRSLAVPYVPFSVVFLAYNFSIGNWWFFAMHAWNAIVFTVLIGQEFARGDRNERLAKDYEKTLWPDAK